MAIPPNRFPPPPFQLPIADAKGMITQQWAALFRELCNRMVGSITSTTLSKDELQTSKSYRQSTTEIASQIQSLTDQISAISSQQEQLGVGRQL